MQSERCIKTMLSICTILFILSGLRTQLSGNNIFLYRVIKSKIHKQTVFSQFQMHLRSSRWIFLTEPIQFCGGKLTQIMNLQNWTYVRFQKNKLIHMLIFAAIQYWHSYSTHLVFRVNFLWPEQLWAKFWFFKGGQCPEVMDKLLLCHQSRKYAIIVENIPSKWKICHQRGKFQTFRHKG